MNKVAPDQWPNGINGSEFSTYKPRSSTPLGLWGTDGWAIKAYGIQINKSDASDLTKQAEEHVQRLQVLTQEEGSFYKTGFAVLHAGSLANWLLFQWWTHDDVWCQLLSYSNSNDPLNFKFSTRPIVACVYETAIIWHEQKSWINHVLNGSADRRAYLEDMMTAKTC